MSLFQTNSLLFAILMILICIYTTNADLHCTDPQKGFYMSYNAISKRDTMPQLFVYISSKAPRYNVSWNNGKGAQFVITNLHPQLYYNQHHQIQNFLDGQHINVTLGDIQFAYRLDFDITNTAGGMNQTGWARGRVLLDQTSYFIKNLLIKDGYLQWDPVEETNLTLNFPISIEYSNPTLSYDYKSEIQLLLNDHLESRKLKTQMMNNFNELYKVNLKEHLNKQDIINSLKLTYLYKNIRIDFLNAVKNYTLSNNQIKGLEAFFLFEAQNKTFNCTPDKINFNYTEYGGLQQIYSISSFTEAFKAALQQGLMNVKLDKKWQVPAFQFYMGDLANSVQYAQNFPADDPFQVSCQWTGNKSQVSIRAYEDLYLQVNVPIVCTLTHKGRQIIEIRTQIGLIVRVYPQEERLTFYITNANIFAPQYKSLEPNYKITNQSLARFSISRVVEGLVKSTTFGTGWKTSKRRFPSVHIKGDYIIVFDPSER